MCNFVEKTHGYMPLLKKGTPFYWDYQAQWAFDNLKHALNHSPVIHPLDYSKDFLLYIASSTTTIAMVLVQENPDGQEHVIYYASKNLMDFETQYSHVEKLALATVIAVQKFCHYIFLCTTTVLENQNPMYYILTRQVLGGKYSRWIVILQEFDLEFSKATSNKSLVFTKLMCDIPYALIESEPNDSFLYEFMFLISTTDPWYGDFLIYI